MAILPCDPVTSPAVGIGTPFAALQREGVCDTGRDPLTLSYTRQRLERLAKRHGLQLVETRHRWSEADGGGEGGFGLIDWEAGVVVHGGGMPWPGSTLDEIINFLHMPETDAKWWRMIESEFEAWRQTVGW
ncbi:MAG: hypothetical protein ACRD1G_01860 [Acidimicrobiales bacterium]